MSGQEQPHDLTPKRVESEKRKFHLVKCDRCRLDKQKVSKISLFSSTVDSEADAATSALEQHEYGQRNATVAKRKAFLAQQEDALKGRANIPLRRRIHQATIPKSSYA
jgi:hypothetical protein